MRIFRVGGWKIGGGRGGGGEVMGKQCELNKNIDNSNLFLLGS